MAWCASSMCSLRGNDDCDSASWRAAEGSRSVTSSESEVAAPLTAIRDADRIPVLHAVTTDEIVLRADFLERARRVMHAGGQRVAVHLRAPRLDGRRLFDLACRLAELQRESGAWLVVNDRADVALTSGARGVQLTSRSMSPADARRSAPTLF